MASRAVGVARAVRVVVPPSGPPLLPPLAAARACVDPAAAGAAVGAVDLGLAVFASPDRWPQLWEGRPPAPLVRVLDAQPGGWARAVEAARGDARRVADALAAAPEGHPVWDALADEAARGGSGRFAVVSAGAPEIVDRLARALARRVSGAEVAVLRPEPAGPVDYGPLLPAAYPAPVLTVPPRPDLPPPERWRAGVSAAASAGAGGVVFRDPAVDPAAVSAAGVASPVPVWLSCPLDPDRAPDVDLAAARRAGVVAVRWHEVPGVPADRARAVLAAAARADLWNHVALGDGSGSLAAFVRLNPNLVPGWSCAGPPPPDPYAGLEAVPGRAYTRVVGGDGLLLPVLARAGRRAVSRWRVGAGGLRVLGERLTYRFEPPDRLPPGQLDEICRLVEAGGAVDTRWVRHNLERAFLVAVAEEDGVLAGDSSLKHPRPEYVARVRDRLGLDIRGFLERGYTSVRPEYRGLGVGTRLLEGLTARAGDRPIYSLIREDDPATQTIARRNRTVKVVTFHSELAGKALGLWMPEETAARRGLRPLDGPGEGD